MVAILSTWVGKIRGTLARGEILLFLDLHSSLDYYKLSTSILEVAMHAILTDTGKIVVVKSLVVHEAIFV